VTRNVPPPPPNQPSDPNALAPLTLHVRPATLRRLRAAAAREGASVEAVAALWLEEYAEAFPDPTTRLLSEPPRQPGA